MGLIARAANRLAEMTGAEPADCHAFLTTYTRQLLREAWHSVQSTRKRRRRAGYVAPTNGTATSTRAAKLMLDRLGEVQARVLDAITGTGLAGATAEEVEYIACLSGNTVRPRLRELEAADLIHRTNRTRTTTSGHNAYVWFRTMRGQLIVPSAKGVAK